MVKVTDDRAVSVVILLTGNFSPAFETEREKLFQLFLGCLCVCVCVCVVHSTCSVQQKRAVYITYKMYVKVKIEFALEQAMKAWKVSRGIALLIL
jgi:hypothetical protein